MKKNVTDILDIHTHKQEVDTQGKSIINIRYWQTLHCICLWQRMWKWLWVEDLIILLVFILGGERE